jgi:hypothetical protein
MGCLRPRGCRLLSAIVEVGITEVGITEIGIIIASTMEGYV